MDQCDWTILDHLSTLKPLRLERSRSAGTAWLKWVRCHKPWTVFGKNGVLWLDGVRCPDGISVEGSSRPLPSGVGIDFGVSQEPHAGPCLFCLPCLKVFAMKNASKPTNPN